MKTNFTFRLLPALLLGLCFVQTGFGQAPAPKKVYSEVYYHKIKPGHTIAEARAIENEFKKFHQAQANDGFIAGWYMLGLDMTTNPNKEYSYITIKNFTDPGLMDDAYPAKYLTGVMGTDYQPKLTDLMNRMRDVKETAKVEIWENLEGVGATPRLAPDKSPIWLMTAYKIKNGQYEEYMAKVKQLKPMFQEYVNTGIASGWNFAGLMYPWANETPYDFAAINQFASMKAMLDDSKMEATFKKVMPGVDRKQFYKELDAMRGPARQELYYLMEFAEKDASVQAKK